jgi:glycosyltransferase involved in cell wall biosynthesis
MGLVSIITPCYNGEKFVARYLDSILCQTYPKIELIFVNDGSNDDTERIALSYKKKFDEIDFSFIYLFQPNAGAAASLNLGLKVFRGSYLTWPDSDDLLDPRSIEKKVAFLEHNKEHGFVRSDAYIYDEQNPSCPIGYVSRKKDNRFNEKIFDDLIFEETYCSPGCYLVRATAFLDVNPNKHIYPSRGGQNWQMLLPLASKYKCCYIDEPLYSYVIRKASHSHSNNSKEALLNRCDEHEDILKNVVTSLDIEKEYYNKIISEKYLHKKLMIAGIHKDKLLAEACYLSLREMGCINNRDKQAYLMSRNIFSNVLMKALFKIRVIFKK